MMAKRTSAPEIPPAMYLNSDEYHEGKRAFSDGSSCPYPIGSGDKRTRWWIGYFDAKNAHLLKARE